MGWVELAMAVYGAYQKSKGGGGMGGGGGGGQVGGSQAAASGYIESVTDHSGWTVNFGNGNSSGNVSSIDPNMILIAAAALFVLRRI